MQLLWLASCLTAFVQWPQPTVGSERREITSGVRITVVYNNLPHAPGLTTAWGFAALVQTGTDTLLFDTGGDGPTLLANLRRLGIDPASISAIVLSHSHRDHTGGLDAILARRVDVTVYMPESFPPAFRRAVERHGARIETVDGPRRLYADLHSTGEMGDNPKEQALIVDTPEGLVVMTGCAHPGIVEIVNRVRTYSTKEVYLLMGGFHLLGKGERELRATIRALRQLGVRKVAPSHCTGDEALALFRESWGSDFIDGGCGAVIEVP